MALESFVAYHGTSKEAADSIHENGFNESQKSYEWLGSGVYFFVEGISDPLQNAKEWARAQSWNAKAGKFMYSHGVVVRAEFSIEAERILDLTITEGLKRIVVMRDKMVSRMIANYETDPIDRGDQTCHVFNFLVDVLQAHAVKQNLPIKSHRERVYKMNVLIPNTTVLCVRKDNVAIKTNVEFAEELR